MIIVSQDRKTMITPAGIELRPMRTGEYGSEYGQPVKVYGYIEGHEFVLGRYKTEEKANKVLSKIQDAYHHCNDIYEMPKEEE